MRDGLLKHVLQLGRASVMILMMIVFLIEGQAILVDLDKYLKVEEIASTKQGLE